MVHDFKGKWITDNDFAKLIPVNVFHRQLETIEINSKGPENSHILFRKKFFCDKDKKTTIFISADDYYKLYINGRFVCQGPAPGYNFHYYYNEVDITDYLVNGENTLAVHTYYQGLINRVWVSGDDRHGLILDIEQDGKVILSSDESFLMSLHTGFEQIGKCGYETQFMEKYISGTKEEGFEKPNFNDEYWENAVFKENTDYNLFPQESKMLVFEDIEPVSVDTENEILIDFGKIYVGYLYAEAVGKKDDLIDIYYGQELDEKGDIRWNLRAYCDYHEQWQLSGNEDRLNQFDYKSFRYVKLVIPENCEISGIKMVSRHYPFELKAKPATDNPDLLKIWDLCVNSLKYGVQEVIQDCMEREKGNYLGDGCYTALAYTVLTGDASMFKKLMDDSFRSRFINKGLMTCAACSMMQEIAEYPLMVYYAMYYYYAFSGDKDYLAQHYDQMAEILDYYKETYALDNGLLCNLDKWCVVEWPAPYRDGYDAEITEGEICTDLHSVINAHYIGAVKYMNKISAVLEKEPYADELPLLNAYTDNFYVESEKLFRDCVKSDHISMVSNAFALMYGLYPDDSTKESIIDYIKERGFTTLMLFGAYPILEGLRQDKRYDLMYEFLSDENAWKRMLREGATTTFEGWGKDAKWNTSLFHLTLSYAVIFLTDWEKYS